jgi:hypothetical protein
MTTLASSLIQRIEAGDGWDELASGEQMALRGILRRVALITTRGKSTAEDWQQLAGFAEWPQFINAGALQLTVAGQWYGWHGVGMPSDLPTHTRVNVRLRSGKVVHDMPAGSVSWLHTGSALDVVAYQVND